MYRIETRDGVVIRKQATRPYQEAKVGRKDKDGTVAFADSMTTKAKNADNEFIKNYITAFDTQVTVRYERVVAIDLEKEKAE